MTLRIDEDAAAGHTNVIGRDLLGERRRGAAVSRQVLITMPWARDAAVYHAPFPERPVLVAAEVGDGRDAPVVTEHGDPLPFADDLRPSFGDLGGGPDVDP